MFEEINYKDELTLLQADFEELKNINEKLSLALDSAEQKLDKAIDYLKYHKPVCCTAIMLNILLGDDKE